MGHKLEDDKFKKDIEAGKFRDQKMVTVTDNWCGNYDGNKISVSIFIRQPYLRDGKYLIRIRASGNDDTFVVLDAETAYHWDAIKIFEHWKKYIYDRIPDGCNVEWFYEHGFIQW